MTLTNILLRCAIGLSKTFLYYHGVLFKKITLLHKQLKQKLIIYTETVQSELKKK